MVQRNGNGHFYLGEGEEEVVSMVMILVMNYK